ILGDTHALIAREKAGIIKPGVPCVTATDEASALETIRSIADERGSTLLVAKPESAGNLQISWSYEHGPFRVRTPNGCYSDLVSGLRGDYQRANAACAIAAVEMIGKARGFAVKEHLVRQAIASIKMPGRFEIVNRNPTIVLDGAHNEMAAA